MTRTVAPRAPGPAWGSIASRRCFFALAAACCGVALWAARTFSLPSGALSKVANAPPGPTATVFWRTRWLPRYRPTVTFWPATNGASVPTTRTFFPRRITRSCATCCTRSSLNDSAAGAAGGGGRGRGGGGGRLRAGHGGDQQHCRQAAEDDGGDPWHRRRA